MPRLMGHLRADTWSGYVQVCHQLNGPQKLMVRGQAGRIGRSLGRAHLMNEDHCRYMPKNLETRVAMPDRVDIRALDPPATLRGRESARRVPLTSERAGVPLSKCVRSTQGYAW